MAKRKLFTELMEAVDETKAHREGKITRCGRICLTYNRECHRYGRHAGNHGRM
ncbi:MAG TPA: hypothetical protein VHX37_17415 [Acidobacteriaceae bacterium]|jgi:hypothetical protein|nr:hypothetical protein [Acidobacteriaceae bacterium]